VVLDTEHVRTGRVSVRIVPHDPMHKIPRRQAQCNLAEVRTVAVGHAQVEQLATPRELELVYFLAEAFFLGADFFLMAFLAGDFLAAAFLAGAFFTGFLAADFLAAAGFLAADFFLAAAGFLAMVFLTTGFLAEDFLTGFLAADFLAAAGFCDGGSGGTTSVLVDSSLTRAMRRRACSDAGCQFGRAISGDANRACANAGAGVPWREAWLSLRTESGRGHQSVCVRDQ